MEQTDLPPQETAPEEPMFNLPPLTLWLAGILLFFFFLMQKESWADFLIANLSFLPFTFTVLPVENLYTLLSYTLLHFGWIHIIINIAGLLAFGSGVERFIGKKYFVIIFLTGSIMGALGHWALFRYGLTPLGGASAGISALFGAILPMLVKRRELAIANAVFIVTNLIVGMMGMPDKPGMSVAWQAHIVGFLTGEAIVFGLHYARHNRNQKIIQLLASVNKLTDFFKRH